MPGWWQWRYSWSCFQHSSGAERQILVEYADIMTREGLLRGWIITLVSLKQSHLPFMLKYGLEELYITEVTHDSAGSYKI